MDTMDKHMRTFNEALCQDVPGICLSAVFSVEITGMGECTLNMGGRFQELNLN